MKKEKICTKSFVLINKFDEMESRKSITVSLSYSYSCLNSPDVIYIHDGGNQSGPVIGQLCNTNTFVELVSTGPDLYIQFVSKSHAPGQGFKGKFFFESTYSFPGSSGQTNSLEIPSTGKNIIEYLSVRY